ncbi:L-serine ammonia-lyase, iron-sulfur-dependent, subunit beta [Paenibacillus typhae]|nr:L-serine ammonia-lyase, iron-sulfur-dependent, subunit alpha [Paenibacillus typhae]
MIGKKTYCRAGREETQGPDVYPENSFAEISTFCKANHIRLSDYVEQREGKQIWEFLQGIWEAMKYSIDEGLSVTGILESGLNVERKAKYLYHQGHVGESPETRENRIVSAYAFAVNEQNAAAGTVVTAPTCGGENTVLSSCFR